MDQQQDPKHVLNYRLFVEQSDGTVEQKDGALKGLAEDAPAAIEALENCQNRLCFLRLATTSREHLDAKLVRTMVDDILMDFRGILSDFVEYSAMLLEHAEPLPVVPLKPQEANLHIVPSKTKSVVLDESTIA